MTRTNWLLSLTHTKDWAEELDHCEAMQESPLHEVLAMYQESGKLTCEELQSICIRASPQSICIRSMKK